MRLIDTQPPILSNTRPQSLETPRNTLEDQWHSIGIAMTVIRSRFYTFEKSMYSIWEKLALCQSDDYEAKYLIGVFLNQSKILSNQVYNIAIDNSLQSDRSEDLIALQSFITNVEKLHLQAEQLKTVSSFSASEEGLRSLSIIAFQIQNLKRSYRLVANQPEPRPIDKEIKTGFYDSDFTMN